MGHGYFEPFNQGRNFQVCQVCPCTPDFEENGLTIKWFINGNSMLAVASCKLEVICSVYAQFMKQLIFMLSEA